MGCVYSKPKPQEREPITIDQLERELCHFNNNVRGYWRRKKICLRRVKPKNQPQRGPAPSSRVPTAAEEKIPAFTSTKASGQTKPQCSRKPTNQSNSSRVSTAAEEKGTAFTSTKASDQAKPECSREPTNAFCARPRLLGSEPHQMIQNDLSVETMVPRSLRPIDEQELKLSEWEVVNLLTNNSTGYQPAVKESSQREPSQVTLVQSSQTIVQSSQTPSVQSSKTPSVQSSQTIVQSSQLPIVQSPQTPSVQSSQTIVQSSQTPIVQSSQTIVQSSQTPIVQDNYWINLLEHFHRDTRYHPSRDYNFIREIGRGGFGHVYLARHNEVQGEEYAIKAISFAASDLKSLVTEVAILRNFSHKNIITLKDSYLADGFLYLVTEYVTGVSLYSAMSTFSEGLPENVVSLIIKECLQALDYIHQCSVIHCDIKSDNILVGIHRQVKIIDFGLSVMDVEEKTLGFRGTHLYASPEMASGYYFGNQVDIWSLGIVAIEMFQGYAPLAFADTMECLISWAQYGYNSMNEVAASKASGEFKDFLYNGALQYNPADRLTPNQLLNHPFVKKHKHGDNCPCLPFMVDWVMQEQMHRQYAAG